ncbi:Ubiquitin fusion degradation protein 4, partial [Basidiobolus ranarum]
MESHPYKHINSTNTDSDDDSIHQRTPTRASLKSESVISNKKGINQHSESKHKTSTRIDISKDKNRSENTGQITSSARFRKQLKEKTKFIVSPKEIENLEVKINSRPEKTKKSSNIPRNREDLFSDKTNIETSRKRKSNYTSHNFRETFSEIKKSRQDMQNQESEGSKRQSDKVTETKSENDKSNSSKRSSLSAPESNKQRSSSPVIDSNVVDNPELAMYGDLSDGLDIEETSGNEYGDYPEEGFDDLHEEGMEFDEADDFDDLDEHDEEDEEDDDDEDDYEDEELTGTGEFESSFSGLAGLRGLGGIMSGVSARLKSILGHLRCYQEPSIQLIALQELAEILSVATEDTLTGYFSCDPFVKELVNLMKGSEFSFGEESPEIMLLACRCLSNLMEALPSAVGSVVYNGAIPVLCSKLMEIQYIDLAEQALSTLEKISAEYPTSVVREGGLLAVLMYLDFFSTNVQRTAVTTAANCSRNVPNECFDMIKEVVPILERLLSYSDQKVVDQACLALVRLVESFKYNTEHLESIVSKDLAQNILNLISSSTTSVVSPYLYTQLLTLLRHSAKGSSKLAFELLGNNIVEILYQVLTGSVYSKSEPNHLGDDSVALTKLVNRPGDQVWEALGVAIELLPPLPKDGVFTSENNNPDITKTSSDSDPDLRTDLLKKNPAVMAKFTEVLLPTFIEVFSSTVVTQVRLRVVAALLKTVFYADVEVLTNILKSVPFAGFVAAILSRQDHPMLVVGAVQLAELLMAKLPDLYHLLFYREGVMNEILKLSDNTNVPESPNETSEHSMPEEKLDELFGESSKSNKDEDGKLKESNEDNEHLDSNHKEAECSTSDAPQNPRTPVKDSKTSSEFERTPSAGMRLIEKFAMSLGSKNLSSALTRVERENGISDVRKWIFQKSMEFRTKYIDVEEQDEDSQNIIQSAHKIMSDLTELASKLKGDDSDPLALDTLVNLTKFLKTPDESATSFEFLQSGLMENLLEYLTNPHYSSADLSKRQLAFLHVFVGGPHPSFKEVDQAKIISSEPKIAAFPVLVKKLQQSLTQLEPFEVVTSYQSPLDEVRNSTSMLAKQIKLKLIPEEGLEVPTSYSNLVVSIHAIATFKALDDYLKPRVAFASSSSRLGERLSSSRLANAFAAFAAAAGLSG